MSSAFTVHKEGALEKGARLNLLNQRRALGLDHPPRPAA